MRTYENREYDFVTAVYWVIVTMTTVGYGDIYFTSAAGYLFSIIVSLSGVIMVFALLFPLIVTPWLKKTIRKDLPYKVPVNLQKHIIICGYNQLVETLIAELKEEKVPFVVIDDSETQVRKLISRKILCVYGDATDEKILLNSNILPARILIANQNDEKNASIILTAKGLCDIKVISLVENTARSGFLRYAGADRVVSPKTLFGTYIGRKAIDPLTNHLAGATQFFEDLNIIELPIYPKSPLIGKKLISSGIREQTGANVVGIWTGGRLSLNPRPDDLIRENSVILAVGSQKQLEDLKKMTRGYT
jgi:voltage-gated potassium channel